MKNTLSKILAMVIAVLMVMSMFSFAAFAAEETTGDVVATPDEPVVELNYYLVGYINGTDYGIEGDWANNGDYLFVDGKVTVELTQDSYVIVKDENGVGYWTDGWQGENPGTVTLGEFGTNDNKMHVAAGNVEFTFDAATLTLTATPVVEEPEIPEVETPDEPVVETPDEPVVETPDEPVVETKYFLEGYINNADYYGDDYAFVDGTVTIELSADSYFYVRDEFGQTYWTDGWKDFNPGTVTLGQFAVNDKMHVSAGTVTFTFDAETFTLTATVA